MSEHNKRQPKSDFAKSVGEPVEVFLAEAEQLAAMGLPIEAGRIEGRLVGVDRPGLWVEPKAWLDAALDAGESVKHAFIKWENVLGVVRPIAKEKFETKKEYRGLRPRN